MLITLAQPVLMSGQYRSATVMSTTQPKYLRHPWRYGCTIYTMSREDEISKIMSEMGRRGGQARAKALTAKQRKESARKAWKAAAKAHRRAAKERKAQNG